MAEGGIHVVEVDTREVIALKRHILKDFEDDIQPFYHSIPFDLASPNIHLLKDHIHTCQGFSIHRSVSLQNT